MPSSACQQKNGLFSPAAQIAAVLMECARDPIAIVRRSSLVTASAPALNPLSLHDALPILAGTTSNNINVSHVNILISTDNGESYTTLTANTPNDGNETITLPASLENTYNGRIKIEAVNNIFYTVSKPLTIWDPAMSNESFEKQTLKIFPNPAKDVLNISFSSEKNGRTQYSIFDLN